MNSITIAISAKTNLTLQLEKKFDIEYYQKVPFFKKIFSTRQKYPDIYFHRGALSQEAVELIEKSKIVIVNAALIKKIILQKLRSLNPEKIEVLYPYYHTKIEFSKTVQNTFREKHSIDKKIKILFIRGKDLQKSGLAVLFDIISRMYKENFMLLIESSAKQIAPLRLKMQRNKPSFEYLLFEDYTNIEELFIASDIFILPTVQQYFSLDILLAMYYRNAVFLMQTNGASEIIDVFSTIQSAGDRSVSFKIDSLLINKDELKKIQKENQKIAKEYSLVNSVSKMTQIIEKSFDF